MEAQAKADKPEEKPKTENKEEEKSILLLMISAR